MKTIFLLSLSFFLMVVDLHAETFDAREPHLAYLAGKMINARSENRELKMEEMVDAYMHHKDFDPKNHLNQDEFKRMKWAKFAMEDSKKSVDSLKGKLFFRLPVVVKLGEYDFKKSLFNINTFVARRERSTGKIVGLGIGTNNEFKIPFAVDMDKAENILNRSYGKARIVQGYADGYLYMMGDKVTFGHERIILELPNLGEVPVEVNTLPNIILSQHSPERRVRLHEVSFMMNKTNRLQFHSKDLNSTFWSTPGKTILPKNCLYRGFNPPGEFSFDNVYLRIVELGNKKQKDIIRNPDLIDELQPYLKNPNYRFFVIKEHKDQHFVNESNGEYLLRVDTVGVEDLNKFTLKPSKGKRIKFGLSKEQKLAIVVDYKKSLFGFSDKTVYYSLPASTNLYEISIQDVKKIGKVIK